MNKKKYAVLMLFVILILNIGCSRVIVRKIPNKAEYKEDDFNQKKVDRIEGFRYYLPRPYLVVKQAFPVAGGEYIINGRITNEGYIQIVETESLPKELQIRFPNGLISPTTIQLPERDSLGQKGLQSKEGVSTDNGKKQEGSEELKPEVVENGNEWLKGSTIDPAILQKNKDGFVVSIVLSQNFPFTMIKEVEVGILPVDDQNKPLTDKFIKLKEQKKAITEFKPKDKDGKNGVDGKYEAHGQRTELVHGPDHVVALRFKGTKAGNPAKEGTFLMYQTTVTLHAMGVEVAQTTPQTVTQTETQQTQEEKSDEQETTKTSTVLTLSGDPRTDPLQKINDLFDIIYLPDFTEQYAVKNVAGLGDAKATIGFENGWMMEHASVQIDNRELGNFIFHNVEKFIDIAAEVAKTKLHPGESASEEITDESKLQAEKGSTPSLVLLRIRYLFEAAPGLYPILKPHEMEYYDNKIKKSGYKYPKGIDHILIPYSPFTVIAYNGIQVVHVELINIKRGSETQKPKFPTDTEAEKSDKKRLIEALVKEKDEISPNILSKLNFEGIIIESSADTKIIIPIKPGKTLSLGERNKDKYRNWQNKTFKNVEFKIVTPNEDASARDALIINYDYTLSDILLKLNNHQGEKDAGREKYPIFQQRALEEKK